MSTSKWFSIELASMTFFRFPCAQTIISSCRCSNVLIIILRWISSTISTFLSLRHWCLPFLLHIEIFINVHGTPRLWSSRACWLNSSINGEMVSTCMSLLIGFFVVPISMALFMSKNDVNLTLFSRMNFLRWIESDVLPSRFCSRNAAIVNFMNVGIFYWAFVHVRFWHFQFLISWWHSFLVIECCILLKWHIW